MKKNYVIGNKNDIPKIYYFIFETYIIDIYYLLLLFFLYYINISCFYLFYFILLYFYYHNIYKRKWFSKVYSGK